MKKNDIAEAKAFTKRIKLRVSDGFISDLQNLKENKNFYKSFWRHPNYAKNMVGVMSDYYVKNFKKKLKKGAKILDMGCGPGYFSLELARNGFDVTGVDISDGAILEAIKTSKKKKNKNLKLRYFSKSFSQLDLNEKYDGILCSGFLHHIPEIKKVSKILSSVAKKNSLLIIHEPQHSRFTKKDASEILMIRSIFASLGLWYNKKFKVAKSENEYNKLLKEITYEYKYERDKQEKAGQSPNDLSCDRDEILNSLKKHFLIKKITPSFSYTYRLFGGIRFNQAKLNKLSDFVCLHEKIAVKNKRLNANYFFCNLIKK